MKYINSYFFQCVVFMLIKPSHMRNPGQSSAPRVSVRLCAVRVCECGMCICVGMCVSM